MLWSLPALISLVKCFNKNQHPSPEVFISYASCSLPRGILMNLWLSIGGEYKALLGAHRKQGSVIFFSPQRRDRSRGNGTADRVGVPDAPRGTMPRDYDSTNSTDPLLYLEPASLSQNKSFVWRKPPPSKIKPPSAKGLGSARQWLITRECLVRERWGWGWGHTWDCLAEDFQPPPESAGGKSYESTNSSLTAILGKWIAFHECLPITETPISTIVIPLGCKRCRF